MSASIWLTAFLGCVVGSFVPIINTELLILGIAALAPGAAGWLLVLVATVGTMTGKTVLYYGGIGILKLPIRRSARIERLLAEAHERQNIASGVLLASALIGLPPLYIVTVVAGMIRLNMARFWLFGFVGRFLRFAAVVFAPQVIRGLVTRG